MGAKCDLAKRVVPAETVPQFVESHGLEYVELSAKQDINTRKPLELLAAKLMYVRAHTPPPINLPPYLSAGGVSHNQQCAVGRDISRR